MWRKLPVLIAALCFSNPVGSGTSPVKRFVVLYSVNNSGYIDVCGCKAKKVKQGSLSRRYTVVKTVRAEGKPVILLDGGSCFFPIQETLPHPYERNQLRSKAFVIVESMNRMGYAAMALGSSDLLLGLDVLRELEKEASFPILCANFLSPNGKPVFPSHTIVEAGGVKIGIVGLIMGTLNPYYINKVAPGCSVKDPIETAKRQVAALKDKVDLIFALSHLRKEENQKLAAEVPEISLIFDPNINYGSYSLFMADPKNYVDRFGSTLVVRADAEGMRLARIDVEFEIPLAPIRTSPELNRLERGVSIDPIPDDLVPYLGRGNFNRAVVSRISIEPHYLADPGIEALIEAWKKQGPGELSPETLKKLKAATPRYVGKDACKDCHQEQYSFWEKTPHSKAYEALRKTGDHQRYDCIGCHTVGFGQAFIDVRDAPKFAGVQCECCHGTNPDHIRDPEKSPKWAKVTEHTCLVCHNKHQIRIDFDYWAKISSVSCPKMSKAKK